MNKLLVFVCTLISLQVQAQINLTFDKRYVECEDKWVAFSSEDSSYLFGFIYIDAQEGFTMEKTGTFKIKPDGEIEVNKMSAARMITRLEPNHVKVAIIPAIYFDKLQISATPDWLQNYKHDLNTAQRQYRWGYFYNEWNECAKALTFLLKAKELDPQYEGLAAELAFSYNCLHNYESAIRILEEQLVRKPADAYANKEYIYSVINYGIIEKATTQYYKSIQTIPDDKFKAENCFNIMGYFYKKNDKENFTVWSEELKKWPVNNELNHYADLMKKQFK